MQPVLEVTLRDPFMDVEGYVVVWNTAICADGPFNDNGKRTGMGKGGTRITPDLALGDTRRLARTMALKNAAAGLKMGGAKSGLRSHPDDPQYEQKYRRFVQMVKQAGILYEDGGIFGGFGYDVGNRPPFNAQWACDELQSFNSFTGKPLDMGGTNYESEGIAGMGVAVAARTVIQKQERSCETIRFSVQGLGAMGAAVARYFHTYGGKLVTLSDPKYGGTWNIPVGASDDLIEAFYTQDIPRAKKCLAHEGSHTSDDCAMALYAAVDIVFPCAMEDAITAENADKVQAPIIVEGANNPVTNDAYTVLQTQNRLVIPGLLANAGGIIAAYVELTADVPLAENITNHTKTGLAKTITEQRITENVKDFLAILDNNPTMQADQVALYMTYRNLFAADTNRKEE